MQKKKIYVFLTPRLLNKRDRNDKKDKNEPSVKNFELIDTINEYLKDICNYIPK